MLLLFWKKKNTTNPLLPNDSPNTTVNAVNKKVEAEKFLTSMGTKIG